MVFKVISPICKIFPILFSENITTVFNLLEVVDKTRCNTWELEFLCGLLPGLNLLSKCCYLGVLFYNYDCFEYEEIDFIGKFSYRFILSLIDLQLHSVHLSLLSHNCSLGFLPQIVSFLLWHIFHQPLLFPILLPLGLSLIIFFLLSGFIHTCIHVILIYM